MIQPEENFHARFSPSKLPRIIRCPGSVKLTEALQQEQRQSAAAAEGTTLHAITESYLRQGVYQVPKSDILNTDSVINADWRSAVNEVLDFVSGLMLKHADDVQAQYIESKVSLKDFVSHFACDHLADVAGTVDFIFIAGRELYVCDWKFGKGIVVEAGSEQLMAYAAGVLKDPARSVTYSKVHCVIVQPRIPSDQVKSITYTTQELVRWVQWELSSALKKVDDIDPVLNPSVKACKWCQVANTCRARFEDAQRIAGEVFAVHAKLPNNVTPEEIASLLAKIPMLDQYIKGITNFAFQEITSGRTIPGYKVVRGRSIRAWSDVELAKNTLTTQGYDLEDFSEVKFYGPAAVEKIIGKKVTSKADWFKEIVVKPEGNLTLTTEDDKREAVSCQTASEVFEGCAQIAE